MLFAVFMSGISGCGKELLSPGRVSDSTIVAGSDSAGLVNGIGKAARFNHPFGLALDASGNLYVADAGNHVIRKMDPSGRVTTFAGMGGIKGSANGVDTLASFNKPFGVATDASGNVYVADAGNNEVRINQPGGVGKHLCGNGCRRRSQRFGYSNF